MDESIYYDIIRGKTATLIAACCAAGTASVTKNQEHIDAMHEFGINVGIAFQIKDDLFDYTQSPLIGKPTGIDIREQKMTLPLIYTLNTVDKKLKNYIINVIKNHHKDDKKVAEVIALVKENGGLEYAKKRMQEYHNTALDLLNPFDDNKAKQSLVLLLDYVVNRQK